MDKLFTTDSLNTEETAIFGLRYLEEEAADIHDIVGCLMNSISSTGCTDDQDNTPVVADTSV